MSQAHHQSGAHGIADGYHDGRNDGGRLLDGERRRRAGGDDDVHLQRDELGNERR
jgi:hypothetical protein